MLKCTRVIELLPDYSVALLDHRTEAAVDSHLEICEVCRRELKTMDAAVALVAQHGGLQPPVGLFNAVRNRIEAGEAVRERRPWWFWFNTTPARSLAMGMAVLAIALPFTVPVQPSYQPIEISMHGDGPEVTSSALASSIRQHAMSAGEGPLTDRVAWEAMALLANGEREPVSDAAVENGGRSQR